MSITTTQKLSCQEHFIRALENVQHGVIAATETLAESERLTDKVGQAAALSFAVTGVATQTGSEALAKISGGTGTALTFAYLGLKFFQLSHRNHVLTSEVANLKAQKTPQLIGEETADLTISVSGSTSIRSNSETSVHTTTTKSQALEAETKRA